MADVKISGLPASTLPLVGTEVLPIVQSGVTKKVATDDLTVKNVRSNATTGLLQIAGPAAASTRVMTTPNANFTAARTDADQSFTGTQTMDSVVTGRGSLAIAATTTSTIFTVSANGMYNVYAAVYGPDDAASFTCIATVVKAGNSAVVRSKDKGSLVNITVSGLDVQVTNEYIVSLTFNWTYLLITA